MKREGQSHVTDNYSGLTFGAVASAVLGVYSIVTDLRGGTQARIRRRIDESSREAIRDRVKKSALFKDLSQLAAADAARRTEAPRVVKSST